MNQKVIIIKNQKQFNSQKINDLLVAQNFLVYNFVNSKTDLYPNEIEVDLNNQESVKQAFEVVFNAHKKINCLLNINEFVNDNECFLGDFALSQEKIWNAYISNLIFYQVGWNFLRQTKENLKIVELNCINSELPTKIDPLYQALSALSYGLENEMRHINVKFEVIEFKYDLTKDILKFLVKKISK